MATGSGLKLKLKGSDYHRNGIAGNGFNFVSFTDKGAEYIGILFSDQCAKCYEANEDCNHDTGNVAILDKASLLAYFNGERVYPDHWRGDVFETEIRRLLSKPAS